MDLRPDGVPGNNKVSYIERNKKEQVECKYMAI